MNILATAWLETHCLGKLTYQLGKEINKLLTHSLLMLMVPVLTLRYWKLYGIFDKCLTCDSCLPNKSISCTNNNNNNQLNYRENNATRPYANFGVNNCHLIREYHKLSTINWVHFVSIFVGILARQRSSLQLFAELCADWRCRQRSASAYVGNSRQKKKKNKRLRQQTWNGQATRSGTFLW